ncbi:hypothetical protein QP028_08640 [Corynebacterium suedekumii]|nr:hypothetical protein QP028_08640 [Corynebacterium suedekumii]
MSCANTLLGAGDVGSGIDGHDLHRPGSFLGRPRPPGLLAATGGEE